MTIARVWQQPPRVSVVDRFTAAARAFWRGPTTWKDPALSKLYGAGYETASGISVTPQNAFTFSAVFDAVNQIASDVGKLPGNLHKRRKDGGSDIFEDSKTHDLMRYGPNDEMGSMVFRRTIMAHALTCHGGYAEIERDMLDRPIAMWLLTPDRVEPIRQKDSRGRLGRVVYRIDGDDDKILQAKNVFHIHGLGYDGFMAYPVINMARQAIGLALAMEKFGGTYFGNGTQFGGVLETDADLTEDQKTDIKNNIEAFRNAQDSAFRILVTEAGRKFTQFANKPNESQMDESRIRQVEEVARFFRMSPHRLGVNTPGTVSYSSVEASNLDYYTGCLLDWVTLFEQESNRKLIPYMERRQQFFKLNVRAFLRGTIKERYDALAVAHDRGIINADDWLDLEDMNPQPDGQGKVYLVQGAMVPKDLLIQLNKAKIEKLKAPAPAPAVPPADGTKEPPAQDPEADRQLAEAMQRAELAATLASEARESESRAREALAAAQARGDASGAEIERLQTALTSATAFSDQFQIIVQFAQSRAAALEAECTRLYEANSTADSTRAAAEAAASEALARVDAAERDVARLSAEVSDAARIAEDARTAAGAAAAEAERLRNDVTTTTTERDQASSRADELQRLATELEAERTALTARVNDAERSASAAREEAAARIATIESEIVESRRILAERESSAGAAAERVQVLEAELAGLRSELGAIGTARDEAIARAAETASTLAGLQAEHARAVDELATQFAQAQQRIDALSQEAAGAGERRTTIEAELVHVRADLAAAVSGRESAMAVANDEALAAADLRSQVETLTSATGAANARVRQLEADLDTATADAAAHLEAVRQLEQAIRELRAEVQSLTDAMATERESHEAAIVRVRADNDALTEQLTSERAATADLSSSLATVMEQLASSEEARNAAVAAATSERESLQGNLGRMSEEMATVRAEHSALATRASSAETTAAAATAAAHAERASARARQLSVLASHRGLIVDVFTRMTRLEARQARSKQATAEKLRRWLDGFAEMHAAVCVEALLPSMRVRLAWRAAADKCAGCGHPAHIGKVCSWEIAMGTDCTCDQRSQDVGDATEVTTTLVTEHIALFLRQLRSVLESAPEDFHADLDRMLTRWENERPTVVADALLLEEMRDVSS